MTDRKWADDVYRYFGQHLIGPRKRLNRQQSPGSGGSVIPGVYAVGLDAGGMYGDSYNLIVPGSTLGFAVNSERIAGENALKYIAK